MKVGIITILSTLLLALPAFAGTGNPCDGEVDTDNDGFCDIIDNCSLLFNDNQYDGDGDGYGDACDCDFSASANNFCDGSDFNEFAGVFNTATPPTNCEFDMAQPPNSFVDGTDFNEFADVFNTVPGPACGNAPGTPCADPGVPCP
jgi:hypothetical protein